MIVLNFRTILITLICVQLPGSLKLNASKCNVVSDERNIVHDFNDTFSGTTINRTEHKRFIFDSKLKFNKQIDDKVNKAYQNLRIIKLNFIHLTANCFVFL